jgi:hypothetical protein
MPLEPQPASPAGGVGTAIKQALDVVEDYGRPLVIDFKDPLTGAGAPAILTKGGIQAVPASIFDDYLPAPRFRRGTATLTDLDSFIEHTNRFKSEASAVFANDDRTSPGLVAVLDYHPEGSASSPDFGRHRAVFKFPLSDEWRAWHKANGPDNAMGMRDFAEFLEDRITDVEHPLDSTLSERTQAFVDKLGGSSKIANPTRLLELSQGLSINENNTVKQANKLQSGEGHVVFNSEHVDDAGQAVDIPSMFVIVIPVFKKGAYYRILARLRYRVGMGQVKFWYELWRTDLVFDDAFNEALVKVKADTELPLFLGTPEA